MSRRILVVGLVVIALLIAVPVVVMIAVQRGGEAALEAERAKWEPLGGVPQLSARRPAPVRPEDNAGALYVQAAVMAAPLLRTYHSEDPERFFAAGICDAEGLDAILDLTWRAAALPACDWDAAYEAARPDGDSIGAGVRDLVRLLATAAECRAESGDEESAGRAIAAGIALASNCGRFDSLLNALGGAYNLAMLLEVMHEVFRDREFANADGLERVLDAIDYDRLLRQTLLGEVATGYSGFVSLKPNAVMGGAASLVGWSFDGDLAHYLATMRRTVEQLELEPQHRDWSLFDEEAPRTAQLSQLALPPIGKSVGRLLQIEARLLLAREAIKLREHRAANGAYPDSWPMPIDPTTGTPLRYERDGDGFVLWSDAEVREGRERIEWRWR